MLRHIVFGIATLVLLPSLAVAGDFIDICDRGSIGDEIASQTGHSSCTSVSVEKMADLKTLWIDDPQLKKVKNGVKRYFHSPVRYF